MRKQMVKKAGRPRKYTGRQRTSVELSLEVVRFLDDKASESRSQCIERVIRESHEFASWQNWDRVNQAVDSH